MRSFHFIAENCLRTLRIGPSDGEGLVHHAPGLGLAEMDRQMKLGPRHALEPS